MSQEPFGFGVFLPVANGGWVVSTNSPVVDGSYALNRRVAVNAERLGFDYVIGMAKWRGYGGPTKHWDRTIESLAMCAGLAEATSRLDVICTIHTTVFHPVPLAKMLTTLDHISGGRAGVNIVCGSHAKEIAQMGIVQPGHDELYDLGREWIHIMKRLWSEDRVTMNGEYFNVKDCVSDPKPLRTPHPLLMCAGSSDVGLRYAIEETDVCLTSGGNPDLLLQNGQRTKRIAAELGRTTNTVALLTIVQGRTDAEAEHRVALFNAGADAEALATMAGVAKKRPTSDVPVVVPSNAAFRMAGFPIVGDFRSIADQLTRYMADGQYDGAVLTFPDFDADLELFGETVLPILKSRGLTRPASSRFNARVPA